MKIRHSLGELSETQQLPYRCRIINRLSEGQIYLDRDTGKQFLLTYTYPIIFLYKGRSDVMNWRVLILQVFFILDQSL